MLNQQRLIMSPSVRETENEDGLALLDVVQGVCFSVNPLGSKIWALLKQNTTTDEISKHIAREYNVPAEEALHDVEEFVGQLIQLKLLSSATTTPRGRFDRLFTFVQRFRNTQHSG